MADDAAARDHTDGPVTLIEIPTVSDASSSPSPSASPEGSQPTETPLLQATQKQEHASAPVQKRDNFVMERPKNPVTLDFSNITFEVRSKKQTREILHGISGSARPGELVAIIGASGAGKTSLLNILSKRINSGKNMEVGGDVLVNGQPATKAVLRQHACYVQQEDILLPTLTVRETFEFSARLRLSGQLSEEEKTERVETLITKLGLAKCAETRIGDTAKRGLSGGEKKRANIGVELVTDPTLVFVDEPTSGLDSHTSYKCMQLLQAIAASGRTVVSTIHQPSSQIFGLFDKLILLAQGQVVYCDRAQDAVQYFSSLGFECPKFSNPADYFMTLMEGDGCDERVKTLTKAWAARQAGIAQNSAEGKQGSQLETSRKSRVSLCREFSLLLGRSFKNFIRTPMVTKVKLAQAVFMALLQGILFYQLEKKDNGVQDRLGALFFAGVSAFMNTATGVILTFPKERVLFLHEQSNDMYRPTSYFLGKIICEIPFQLIYALIMGVIVYFMVGFQSMADKFLIFQVGLWLMALCGFGLGMMIGSLATEAEKAVALVPVAIIPFMLFAGFFVKVDSIPVWIRWIQHISPLKYMLAALAPNELDGLTFDVACPDSLNVAEGVRCEMSGTKQNELLGYSTDEIPLQYAICTAIALGFFVVAYVGLLKSAKRHKA